MNLLRTFQVAVNNLLHVKLRAILAVLGIVVGTGSVVALISSSQLATTHALKQFKSLGINLVAASISPLHQNGGGQSSQLQPISLDDINSIKQSSPGIQKVAPYTQYYGQIMLKGKNLQGTLLGVTSSFPEVVHLRLKEGRFVSDLDKDNYFCVIGSTLAQQVKALIGHSPLDTQLQVGSNIYTVVGVAQPWKTNLFFNQNLNQAIIVALPLSLLLDNNIKINSFLVRTVPDASIEKVKQSITGTLSAKAPGYRISYRDPKQLTSVMGKQKQTFSLLLILVGSIALVVGGIGVMNIMLVSVTERKREIGIRMAIGARPRDIRRMFLLEAILLTTFGGLLGVVVGLLITWFTAHMNHWDFTIDIFPVLLGLGVSVLVGIISGIYPAIRASSLDPIDCLRTG